MLAEAGLVPARFFIQILDFVRADREIGDRLLGTLGAGEQAREVARQAVEDGITVGGRVAPGAHPVDRRLAGELRRDRAATARRAPRPVVRLDVGVVGVAQRVRDRLAEARRPGPPVREHAPPARVVYPEPEHAGPRLRRAGQVEPARPAVGVAQDGVLGPEHEQRRAVAARVVARPAQRAEQVELGRALGDILRDPGRDELVGRPRRAERETLAGRLVGRQVGDPLAERVSK